MSDHRDGSLGRDGADATTVHVDRARTGATSDFGRLLDDPRLVDVRDSTAALLAEVDRTSGGLEARLAAALALADVVACAYRRADDALTAARDALVRDRAQFEEDKRRGHKFRGRMQAEIDRLKDELVRVGGDGGGPVRSHPADRVETDRAGRTTHAVFSPVEGGQGSSA